MGHNSKLANVFVAGGTGYVGQRLISELSARGYRVRALTRRGSEMKIPADCEVIIGDPLDRSSFESRVSPCSIWIHLVGVPHPNPRKADQFRAVDLRSVEVAVPIALAAGIRHFVYVSVAHPAPVMKSYIEVRGACEDLLRNSVLNCTFLRPWYILGPGHRWPYLLIPLYKLLETIPSTSDTARRLGLVTLPEIVSALIHAVENPSDGIRVIEVPQIRALSQR